MAPRMVALMLVGLAVAAVAPVGAEDLGEGAGFHGSEKEALDLMHKAQKIWEKGERPDGSESVGKMETALDHTIDKSMSGVEQKVEHQIEETAIKGNEPHPAQFATDEAKQVVRGIRDSERLVGDDIAEFNKGYKKAENFAKSQGGGVIPDLGEKVDEGLNAEFHQVKTTQALKRAMETYVPKSALSLVQLENTPSKEVIEGAKQDKEALGKPDLAAKIVAQVEHIPVEKVTGKATAPTEVAHEAAAAPAPVEKKAEAEPARTAAGLPNAKKYIDEVMDKVKGDVDIQFAPVEEQLGYNLHQEVKLARHQVAAVKAAAQQEQGVHQREKDLRQANAIALAAKHAEAEALKMKKAVNQAKAEHAANGEVVSLLELGESAEPSSADMRQVIQKKAVKIMNDNLHLQDVMQKAMNDAEAKVNTELNPILPTSMLPRNDQQANNILYHTMPLPSQKVQKETSFVHQLEKEPTALIADKAKGKITTPGAVEELLEESETPVPASFDPFHKQVSLNFKLHEVLDPHATEHVEQDLNKAVGENSVIEKLSQAAVERVEANDHAAFQGLGSDHSYHTEQKLNTRMNNLGREVVDARISAAEQVDEGRLPNGNKVHLKVVKEPLDGSVVG